MTSARLQRLRAMRREELAFRARAAARIQIDRLAFTARHPRWDRSDLSRVLAPYVLDAPMADAIRRADWLAADRMLVQTIRSRPARFVIDHGVAPELRAAILRRWPEAAEDARTRADRMLEGECDLLGYRALRVGTGGSIDWHFDPVSGQRAPRTFWADVPYLDPSIGDHKVIWELNRHQHWLALGRASWLTGDRKYGREIVVQLRSWLADNPPLAGINWASMLELAFRSLSWVAALHLLLGDANGPEAVESQELDSAPALSHGDSAWLVDMLIGIHHQLEHVSQNLSAYFSPNTHLLGEALALYVVGQSLPEMSRSARWTDAGRRILLDQIGRQIEPDGGHAERSLHYHRYTLDFYLLALLAAERGGDEEAASAFREAAGRLATFLLELADDNGRTPLIGDDDGGMLWPIAGRDSADVRDSLSLAATVLRRGELARWGLCEETMWLAWSTCRDRLGDGRQPVRHEPAARLTAFPQTGYVVALSETGDHLVFDAGPHGYLNCGHAHADALAVTLAVGGRPLLVDPGTACYTVDPSLRDRMRRTASHNTLCVGGRSSSEPSGAFQWRSRADGRLEAAIGNAGFGWMEGSHDGYFPFRHRRSIAQVEGGWLFFDELLGQGESDVQLHWHFHPDWAITRDSGGAVAARHREGTRAWVVHDRCALLLARGDDATGLGWCSPRYGALVPTWTARLSRTGPLPVSTIVWIGAAVAGESAPTMERLQPDSGPAGAVTAVRLRRGDVSVTAMMPLGAPTPDAGSWSAAGYHANARMLYYAARGDAGLESLAVVRCTDARAVDPSLLSLAADARTDVHLRIRDNRLTIHASEPPPQLRLEGAALEAIRVLSLNGREHAVERTIGGSLVVSGADWPAPLGETGVDVCVA